MKNTFGHENMIINILVSIETIKRLIYFAIRIIKTVDGNYIVRSL